MNHAFKRDNPRGYPFYFVGPSGSHLVSAMQKVKPTCRVEALISPSNGFCSIIMFLRKKENILANLYQSDIISDVQMLVAKG